MTKKQFKKFRELWDKFGDVAIDEYENIEETFLHFPIGTFRQDVWAWFEEEFDISIGRYMQGLYKFN